MKFTVVNLNITETHLNQDGMHIHHQYQPILFDNIRTLVDDFFKQRAQPLHTVIRSIDHAWQLSDLKAYLKYKQINFKRLPEVIIQP